MPFDEGLIAIHNSLDRQIQGNIVAVKETKSFFICPACKSEITDVPIDDALLCQQCHAITLTDICTLDGSVTFCIKSSGGDNTQIETLTIYKALLQEHFENTDHMCNNIMEATKTLLRVSKVIIHFNKISHIVSHAEISAV